jgi:predicted RNA-binding protein with PIN domain
VSKINYILVDGYNVINVWKELKEIMSESLEDARHMLVEMLHDFASYSGSKIIVVYDAHYAKGGIEKHEKHGNIDVVYTKEGESADVYIERNVVELSKKALVAVITSDYLEQRITLQMGGIRITPNEFLIDIKGSRKKIRDKTKLSYVDKKNSIEDFVDKDIMEKLEKMRRNL